MIIDITRDPEWTRAFAAVDRAFAGVPRPQHFTDHPYCDECADADEFFQAHTPETFGAFTEPMETLPLSFLTEDGFRYLAPGILRYLPRTFPHYNVSEVLFFLENRWQTFTPDQQIALRDLLYLTYDRLADEINATPFDQHTMTRILNELDRVTQPDATS